MKAPSIRGFRRPLISGDLRHWLAKGGKTRDSLIWEGEMFRRLSNADWP
jgi:hypothetical protein